MNVAQYTFQSPSSSQVQVGKLDPSSVEQEKPKETTKETETETKTVVPSSLLDVYA